MTLPNLKPIIYKLFFAQTPKLPSYYESVPEQPLLSTFFKNIPINFKNTPLRPGRGLKIPSSPAKITKNIEEPKKIPKKLAYLHKIPYLCTL